MFSLFAFLLRNPAPDTIHCNCNWFETRWQQ